MKGKFIITRTHSQEYTFELIAANGESIAKGNTFPNIESCENIIDSIRRNSKSPVEDRTTDRWKAVTYPKYEIYKNLSGDFYFRLKSASCDIIAYSESYTSKSACIKGIRSIGKNADSEIIIKNDLPL